VAVSGDLPAVLGLERRPDVEHHRQLRHIRDDITDRFLESGIFGSQGLALDEHRLARWLLETVFEDLLHSTRLARAGGARSLLRPDDERPDREGSEDEGKPAEDGDLSVMSAPAAHAAGQIGRVLARVEERHGGSLRWRCGTPAEGRSRICPPGARANEVHTSLMWQGSRMGVYENQG
jgi:hypothetical protein